MDEERLVSELGSLGLTRNQSLAYLTLLADPGGEGLTGYEVGARSGVPRSAVYNVLRQLEEVGAAFSVGQEPQRFIAASPDQWVDRVRRTTLARLDSVTKALEALPRRTRPEPVWIVRRYDELVARLTEMITHAERSVWLSLWRRELDAVRPALAAVAERDLHAVLHCPEPIGEVPAGFSAWLDERPDPAKAGWAHRVLAVVDRREALIGGSEPDVDNDAVWTTNPSLVDVATNHVILDVTLLSARTGRSCEAVVAPMMRPHLGR